MYECFSKLVLYHWLSEKFINSVFSYYNYNVMSLHMSVGQAAQRWSSICGRPCARLICQFTATSCMDAINGMYLTLISSVIE